ncbi:unnamed protein product [Ectocarpus fasciculatus]
MMRLLFAFEDVVLYIFVVVRFFFVWMFSTVHSRAMNLGLSNIPTPPSLPLLASGSPSVPPAPADLAPAPPQSSGSRSTWSTCGRIVEGVLSAVVLYYLYLDGFTPKTLLAMWLSLDAATDELLSQLVRLRMWVEDVDLPESPGIDGGGGLHDNDRFRLHYFGVLALSLLFGLMVGLPYFVWYFIHEHVDSFLTGTIIVLVIWVDLTLVQPRLIEPRLTALWDLCISQPRCRRVRAFLLAMGTFHVVVWHLSPVPSKWTWSLVILHSNRLLSLLVFLRGDNEGVADAAV